MWQNNKKPRRKTSGGGSFVAQASGKAERGLQENVYLPIKIYRKNCHL